MQLDKGKGGKLKFHHVRASGQLKRVAATKLVSICRRQSPADVQLDKGKGGKLKFHHVRASGQLKRVAATKLVSSCKHQSSNDVH